MTFSLMTVRRLKKFRANRRGFLSLIIFSTLFFLSLFAEFIANDRPIIIYMEGEFYTPVLVDYAETDLGGQFLTEPDYRDPYLLDMIEAKGWAIWPPIRYGHATINFETPTPAPSPPTSDNFLGTDDQGRDVAARLIYGYRLSVLFGLLLTLGSSVIGISAGAVQGYFGGVIDLVFQRVLEVWGSMPQLLILITISSVIMPGFWTLLIILMLFGWTQLVGMVRAEVLRARNFDYVRAAKALGMGDTQIMYKHVLPNAMVATLTYTPFILSGSLVALTSLDFLGLGLPPGSASLGDLLKQGKENLQAPWLGLAGFFSLAIMLALVVFIGEAVRDAFDPRKNVA